MEALIIITSALTVPGLLYALYQTYLLMGTLAVPGIGRIFFLNMASLEVWAILVIAWFLLNNFFPDWADADSLSRSGARLFFVVYLVLQTLGMNIALYRWRNPRSK